MVDDRNSYGQPLITGSGALLALAPALITALAATLAGLAGCGSVGMPRLAPAQRVTADDFRASSARQAETPTPIPVYVPERPRAPRVEIRSLTEAEARQGVAGVDTLPGDPAGLQDPGQPGGQIIPPADQPPPPAPEVAIDPTGMTLVDAKVGDLNGLPVLARRWLEPLGARLRSESVGMSRAEWRAFAAEQINERLVGDLRDELFLAEARSSLTPQEKAGLRVFLKRFEKDVIRSSYGSETLADEQLRRSSGQGLEGARRERERMALIQTQIREKVNDRVQVPQRDLELEYERNFKQYNPDPIATFRLLRVSTDNAELLAETAEALKSKPFLDLAEDERYGSLSPTVVTVDNGWENASFFGPEPLQAAALGLAPGQSAGPIEVGGSTYWVYLERIDSESRSLYEVQQELRAQITGARQQEEAQRYLLMLFERAGITGIDRLVDRLVVIAEQWYYQGAEG